MYELFFNYDFSDILDEEDYLERGNFYYKKFDDFPSFIKKFIGDFSDRALVYNGVHYCPNCLRKITKVCPKCGFKIRFDKIIVLDDECDFDGYYYVFDVIRGNVILYVIKERMEFNFKNKSISRDICVFKVYLVQKNSFTELLSDEFCSYLNFNRKVLKYHYMNTYLYKDNLDILKNTIYKYTGIWEMADYLRSINLYDLIYYPLYLKEYEYLVKYRLYELALEPYKIKFKGSFRKTFGVDKKYLDFMVKNKISYTDLEALRLCQIEDIDLIDFVALDIDNFSKLKNEYGIDINRVYEYFNSSDMSYFMLNDYFDYIELLNYFGFDMKSSRDVFPNDFNKRFNELYYSKITSLKPEVESKIQGFSEILSINNYEDEKYLIYPADSVYSILKEGEEQCSCLRTYLDRYSNRECQIYFMRRKEDACKSFVTIEIKDGKVYQALSKYNEKPSDDIMKIIYGWAEGLVLFE